MLALAGLLYVTFFVALGPHTLYGHVRRIAGTSEAHDLFGALSTQVDAASHALRERVRQLGRSLH